MTRRFVAVVVVVVVYAVVVGIVRGTGGREVVTRTVAAKPSLSHADALMTNLVRHRLSLRLHVIEGDEWYTQGRCREQVSAEPQAATRFVCALWSQGLHKTEDFYASAVDVRCIAPLTECSWQARKRIEAKWERG